MKATTRGRLSWLNRDAKIIVLASSLRMFGQGIVSITLAVYLADIGLSLRQIGLYFTLGATGLAVLALLMTFVSERFSHKQLLVVLTLTSSTAVAALVLSNQFIVLAVFAFLGTFAANQGANGATQPLIQATLAESAEPRRRTSTFAFYRISNTFARALGTLAAGIPAVLTATIGLSEVNAHKVVLIGVTVTILSAAYLYSLLSHVATATRKDWTNPFRLPSRRTVFVLSGLFSLDAFGGALVIQTLAAYWFYTRFGLDLGALSLVFFGSQILTAISMWAAARIADRIGLLNTMVFTHIPSSLFLLGAAFSPFAWLAIVFWQLRAFFSQMDVPTRDSYIMAIVGPEERVAMASMQQLGRSGGNALGPYLATAMWTSISASAPFVACGTLKIAYDLTLWAMFRNVHPEEERARMEAQRNPS